MAKDHVKSLLPPREEGEQATVTLSGSRFHSVQRLQIGFAGLAAMVLMVGLANIVMERAAVVEATAVPEAASTVGPQSNQGEGAGDPLADAGVVPTLPAPQPQKPAYDPDMLPETGDVPVAPHSD
ncbi:hypothetical protein [Altericroceibacterium endophyticum]|uniref:Uncharacterized protein n=1 Tax=Altericroceibacterium endophyticum TaxID=1808508 RepID=A0A6I4T6L5_9SPHN|nr:hypothetical protein [Altericroceibacterium endophyticum]MXO66467.1 hypothetical protein [Altericroceibacterium endophyticum]